jgi:hypothetical protein
MVTEEEILQAIERLREAGLWAQFKEIGRRHTVERHADSVLFHGFGEPPETEPDSPLGEDISKLKGWFSIWYKNYGSSYSATIPLGQIFVNIKESADFDEIITAIINYFEIKKALPDSECMRWTSVTDLEHGLINAIFWLQRAGATVEILNVNSIRVAFENHVYTMHFDEEEYASIKIEGADTGAQTLEDAVLTILAHQCKLMAVKVDHS